MRVRWPSVVIPHCHWEPTGTRKRAGEGARILRGRILSCAPEPILCRETLQDRLFSIILGCEQNGFSPKSDTIP